MPKLRKEKTSKVIKLPTLTNLVIPAEQTQTILTSAATDNLRSLNLIKKQREAHEDHLQRILDQQTQSQKLRLATQIPDRSTGLPAPKFSSLVNASPVLK